MDKKRRRKQDAAILGAIVLVIIILWQLNRRNYGGMGAGITSNIFGPSTIGLFSSSDQGGGTVSNAPQMTNERMSPESNALPIVPSTNPPETRPLPPPRPTLSSNLMNTSGPVTVIDVPTADLVQTPPGVTAAPTSPEATTIEERLGQASAQGGDIQFSLSWNNMNDLDLHCFDPKGVEIWYGNRVSSRTHGMLDVDQNAHFPFTATPVENIFWPIDGAPPGLYKVFVAFYAQHMEAANTPFTVRVVVRNWKTYYFKSTIASHAGEIKTVCTLKYDPQNPDPEKRYSFVR